jgi:signal transduction histidine kinase
MAECSRIDTEIADQKKSDFIGSISHELRSPLHGILASAEFLGDEVTTGFEKGLVETIDSCGRTLLDTIVSPCSALGRVLSSFLQQLFQPVSNEIHKISPWRNPLPH